MNPELQADMCTSGCFVDFLIPKVINSFKVFGPYISTLFDSLIHLYIVLCFLILNKRSNGVKKVQCLPYAAEQGTRKIQLWNNITRCTPQFNYIDIAHFSTPLWVIVIEQIFVDNMCLEFKQNVYWKISHNVFIIMKAVYVQGMCKESNLHSDLLQLPNVQICFHFHTKPSRVEHKAKS